MKGEEVYDAWAPAAGVWSRWVKPVLFSSLPEEIEKIPPLYASWLDDHTRLGELRDAEDVAIVADLPGDDVVWAGLALADAGYQPIPLFNAVLHAEGVVDLNPVMKAVVAGTTLLSSRSAEGPPAFLLDAGRMGPVRPRGVPRYDNRSRVWATDFPSPAFLRTQGIRRVLLVQESLRQPTPDLERVLLAWQKAGLELWRLAEAPAATPAPFALQPRPLLRRVLTWLGAPLDPYRRADGAYGRFRPQGG